MRTAMPAILCLVPAAFSSAPATAAAPAELGRFEIAEPLGVSWDREWVTRDVEIDTGGRDVPAGRLRIETVVEGKAKDNGKMAPAGGRISLPCQFHDGATGELLPAGRLIRGKAKLRAFFSAVLPKGKTQAFSILDGGEAAPAWQPVAVRTEGAKTLISNGLYEVELDAAAPLPVNAVRLPGTAGTLGVFSWPASVKCTGVQDRWVERGPARAILERTFSFDGPALPAECAEWAKPHKGPHYVLRLDFRAGDPWIDAADDYALGAGTFIRLDLAGLAADLIWHPHSYNARTFKPDGKAEDTTLEPPQHPIATLGPIWRDIWFGGGPTAFIYNSQADRGLGLATVRGSLWQSPDDVSLESQNLLVHGDTKVPGKVWVRIPTDAGRGRHWAIVPGPADRRKEMERLIRARADVPLEAVLGDWVLDWPSKYPKHSFGLWSQWFGPFNRHILNPTTFPRNVRSHLAGLIAKGQKVASRDLAYLAYVFSNPDYWPGPRYRWTIGNPNFNTDMYNVVLQVGLVMPDHPHANRWVEHGLNELKINVHRDSFPGGAWAESLSYSGFFFHIAGYAHLVQQAGAARPFADWPRIKEVLNYLACMHTPVDPRYGGRQKAPIGDTSPGSYVKELNQAAEYYRTLDDKFAEQLARFPQGGPGALDISSREFFGFGATFRGNAYDDAHESFVALKAGPARNHYQGDELSFYFASLGTPLAIDYACHYSPRPWSASMHNRPDMDGNRPVAVACRRAFAASDVADVFVADERTRRINCVPMEPHHTTKPGWEYLWRDLPKDKPWTMRRWTMLVKHDPKAGKLADYLVIRDEIDSPERPWWNLHILARDVRVEGATAFFPGQLGVDLTAHFLTQDIARADKRQWGWGGTMEQRRGLRGQEYEKACFGRYVPEDCQVGTWKYGEMAKWLRVPGQTGNSSWLVVLMPHRRGEQAPKVERLSPTSARITLGDEAETVHLGTEGAHQAAIERAGKLTVLLKPGATKPPAELDFTPVPQGMDRGGL